MFWWWIETKPCNKSIFIKYLSITARPYQWVQLNCDLKKNAFIKVRHLAMIMMISLASALSFFNTI